MSSRTGFFFDYDGTLSPADVDREYAYPPKKNIEMIGFLRSRGHPVFIVSSKDCEFLLSRSLGVEGLACVNGVEIRARGYVLLDEKILDSERARVFNRLVEEAIELVRGDAYIELKRIATREVVGLGIDWRGRGLEPRNLSRVVEIFEKSGFYIRRGDSMPFIDIYMISKRKSEAVEILRRLFSLEKVVYFGDSSGDEDAFRAADTSVLVRHRYNKDLSIKVDYEVNFEELSEWVVSRYAELSH